MADVDKYTPKQFADYARKANPAFAQLSDDQVVQQVLQRYPGYKDRIIGLQTTTGQEFKAPPTGLARAKEAFNTGVTRAGEAVKENIPTITSTVGGLLGAEAGPPGALAGVALGGGAGKAVQRLIGMGQGERPTSGDVAGDIAIEGGKQALYELGGMGLGRLGKTIFPTPRAALMAFGTDADIGKIIPRMKTIMPDIDAEAARAGIAPNTMTIGKFNDVLKNTGQTLENEYNLAIQPIRNLRVAGNSADVAQDVMNEITPNLQHTTDGQKMAAYLRHRAQDFSRREWTVGEMDLERRRISAELADFHAAKQSGQAVDLKTSAKVKADTAIERALKDKVYDLAERSGSKPPGYFTTLKQKQSALKDFRDAVDKGNERLLNQSFKASGAPPWEKVRLHAHLYPRASGMPGFGSMTPRLGSGDAFTAANRQLAKAFPGSASQAARAVRERLGAALRTGAEREAETKLPYKAVTTPRARASQREINALPLRMLFLSGPPAKEDTGEAQTDVQ